jgi:DNA-binding NarL/FixJ family response regulator
MTYVGADDLQALSRALAKLYAHADLVEFPHRALEAVRILVATDHTAYNEIGKDACIGISDPSDSLHDSLVPVFHEFGHQHPRVGYFPTTDDGRARALSDYWSRTQLERSDLYQLVYRPLEVEDQLSVIVAGPDPQISLAFNRSRRGFGDRERTLLDLFRPHFAQALANATAVHRLRHPDAPGGLTDGIRQALIRLGPSGDVRYEGEGARALLDAYLPARRRGRRLPERLRRWIADQTRGLRPHADTHMSLARGRRRLDLRLIPDPATDGWVLLLEERVLPPVEAEATLPPRLRNVLQLLLEGLSEKEAAHRLGLKPSTVHGYVKQVYRRFDVSSRGELLALFVRRPDR